MAIGYKLIGKPVEGIDTSVFTTLSQTLLDQEATREKQRQAWRDEQDALRKSQGDLTPTVNQEANQFFGKFSQGIMDVSTTLQRQLETGEISSSEYTAQWRNLNQSNEQMIAAQTSYQETAQKITEDVANGITSRVVADDLNHFNKVFQPGAMEVESDGRGGLRLFNKETGQVVSPSYLSNLTNSNLPKYDYMKVADTLVEQFGKRGVIDAAGNSIKGVYANMKDDDLDTLIEKEAKSLLEGSQAPTVSILVDGMGYNVVYSKDELKPAEAGKPGFVYRKPDGTFELAKGDQEKAVIFMRDALKNALPLEKKDAPIKKDTDYDRSVKARENENVLSYELAYDITLGGDKAENNKEIIKANNDKIEDLNETEDSWVIEYNDGTDDKIIQKIKKTIDGVETYDREATAEALYTIVDPKSTPIKAQKARQNYFKTREIKTPVSTDLLVSTRQPTPTANTTSYYTNQEAAKGSKAVTINAQIESIKDLDEDSAPKLESIIRGIQTLPGAENFFDEITVKPTPGFRGGREDIRITLPKNLAILLKDKNFVKKLGDDFVDVTVEGAIGGISEEEGRSNLNQLIDALIAEMTNKHNANKGVKSKEESSSNNTGGTAR